MPTPGWVPPAGARRTAGRPTRPWSQAAGARAWSAPAPGPAVAAASPPDLEPTGIAEAFGAEEDLSIVVLDTRLRVRTAFGGLHARSSRLPRSIVGLTFEEVAPAARYPGLATQVAAALDGTGGSLDVRSASSGRVYHATVSPVTDGGAVRGCLIVLRDVTRRHEDESLLAELTEVFELAFDHSPAGQGLLSPDGRWLRVNDALRRMLGRSEDVLVGRSVHDVTHPDDVDRENALLYELVAGRSGAYEIEKRFVHGGGDPVRAYVRMSPVAAPDGTVRGLIAHVVDADRWNELGASA